MRVIFQVQAPGGGGGGGVNLEAGFNGGFFALRVSGPYVWRGLFSEFYSKLQVICAVHNLGHEEFLICEIRSHVVSFLFFLREGTDQKKKSLKGVTLKTTHELD